MLIRGLLLTALVPLSLAWSSDATPPRRVALVAISLHDVSNQPVSPALPDRMDLLTSALRDRLATVCGYEVTSVDSDAGPAAATDPGYLYAHPDVAARLAGADAEWVIVPRLTGRVPG